MILGNPWLATGCHGNRACYRYFVHSHLAKICVSQPSNISASVIWPKKSKSELRILRGFGRDYAAEKRMCIDRYCKLEYMTDGVTSIAGHITLVRLFYYLGKKSCNTFRQWLCHFAKEFYCIFHKFQNLTMAKKKMGRSIRMIYVWPLGRI